MNSNFTSRLDRALNQRIYLIDTEGSTNQVFRANVMGSSDTTYEINIREERSLNCSCPDFQNGHFCKHVIFILIRVLGLSREYVHTNYYAKNSYRTTSQTFDRCQSYLNREKLVGTKNVKKEMIVVVKQRPIEVDDCCPVCFEDFDDKTLIVYCKASCGKSIHQKCFNKWTSVKSPSCVYCRATWQP